MENLVSVILYIHNNVDTLKESLLSIISQNYRNIEIILIDDGSEDGSQNLCNELLVSNSNLKIKHQIYSGIGTSMQNGLNLSKGDLVTFINASDSISKSYISDLVDMINSYADVDIASVKISHEKLDEKNNEDQSNAPIFFDKIDALRQLLINSNLKISFLGKIYRKYVFDNFTFTSNIYDDIFRIFENSRKTAFFNESEYFLKNQNDNDLDDMTSEKINTLIRLAKKYEDLKIYCKLNIVKLIQDEYYYSLVNNKPLINEENMYKLFVKIVNEDDSEIIPFLSYVRRAHMYLLANDIKNYKMICPVLPEISEND